MSDKPDDLLQRYADAVAQDERRPSDRVRASVRAHAQMQLTKSGPANATVGKPRQPAANQSKWTLSLVASVAMMALVGLLVVQIEHGTPEDREVAFGGPTPGKPQAAAEPDANRAPAVASVAAPAQKTAEATPPPPMPSPAAKAAPVIAERLAGATQPDKRVAPPVMASREPEPAAAPPTPAAPPMDAARSLAKSAYNSADTLSNSPAPRDAKTLSRAEATAGASVRPMPATIVPAPVMAATAPPPAPTVVLAPPAPPVVVTPLPPPAPAIAAAPGGAMRQRADGAMPAPFAARFLAAVRAGQLDEMDALLAQGTSVNARDSSGNTALMIALSERQVAVARKLLERGADGNLVNHEGVNALQIAVRMDLPEMVKLLQQPR